MPDGGARLDIRGVSIPPAPSKGATRRREKYQIQDALARIFPQEAVARCGKHGLRRPGGEEGQVAIKVGRRGAHYSGVITCQSVWICPWCAARIAAGRREEVAKLCRAHFKAGGRVYMATLTIRHNAWDKCADTKKAMSTAWSKTIAGAPWQRAKARSHYAGSVRALEVTHGANGWHPHIHVLFFFDGDPGDFGAWLIDRWSSVVARTWGRECAADALDFQEVRDVGQAAEYVTKWGPDWELTHAHIKRAGEGGRSPFQIAEDYARNGNPRDAALLKDYYWTFKGARQLTWQGDLRERYGVDEADDEELAQAEPDDDPVTVGYMQSETLRDIRRKGIAALVLEAAEERGFLGVFQVCSAYGVSVAGLREARPPGGDDGG